MRELGWSCSVGIGTRCVCAVLKDGGQAVRDLMDGAEHYVVRGLMEEGNKGG